MKRFSIKTTLALCSTFTLMLLAATSASADTTTADNPPELIAPVVTQLLGNQQTEKIIDRQITVISPLDGAKTVITQTAVASPDPNEAASNIWQAYFPPVYQGYKPAQPVVPVTVVTPETVPSKVEITYQPLKQDDLRTNTFAGIFFKDINGKQVGPMLCQPVDTNGVVLMPVAPQGWEYIRQDELPDHFLCFQYRDPFYTFLVQKQAAQTVEHPQTKQLTRKIICHLPSGDKIFEQTVTVRRVGNQPWEKTAFPEFVVPVSAGWRSSLRKIEESPADPDHPLVTVEVTYQAVPADQPAIDEEGATPTAKNPQFPSAAYPNGQTATGGAGRETAAFPRLKEQLAQLQAPLHQLENDEQFTHPATLPQTGNHSPKGWSIVGLMMMTSVALSQLVGFKKNN